MATNALEQIRRSVLALGNESVSRVSVADFSDDMRRHFKEKYPIFLDGALPHGGDQEHFLRQARESLANGGVESGLMPAAILREALEAVPEAVLHAGVATKAGITAINSRLARIWWDDRSPDEFGDILASLDKPRPILRFFDVTGLDPESGRWNDIFDIDIDLAEKGRTIEFWSPDRAYVVDVGLLHADGRFLRLARTNPVDLPREGVGAKEFPKTVTSALQPRPRVADTAATPDAKTREWVLARPDHPARDVETEMIVHQLYRAFLEEGPRALRRFAKPLRRSVETLRREFAQRQVGRQRQPAAKAVKRAKKKARTDVLVVCLDAARVPVPDAVCHFPVPVRLSLASVLGNPFASAQAMLYHSAVERARTGTAFARALLPAPAEAVTPVLATPVRRIEVEPLADATPVFAAAESLKNRLTGLEDVGSALSEPIAITLPEESQPGKKIVRAKPFGGAEARRFARAGVRFTRMSLTLEGRMRPGAKLKVAGQLVRADADGCFRVECVLSGRKAAIPLRAGTSIEGEVRSVIDLDWEKTGGKSNKRNRSACEY